MFSSTAEYALRAVVFLAIHRDRLSSSQQIAEATKAPQGYISKILKDLGNAGIVSSQRGPSGGFALAKNPAKLSVLDVINVVDQFQRIKECPLGLPSHARTLCHLHQRLDDALAMVEKLLANTSIEEMAKPRHEGKTVILPTVEGHEGSRTRSKPSRA